MQMDADLMVGQLGWRLAPRDLWARVEPWLDPYMHVQGSGHFPYSPMDAKVAADALSGTDVGISSFVEHAWPGLYAKSFNATRARELVALRVYRAIADLMTVIPEYQNMIGRDARPWGEPAEVIEIDSD